MNSYDIYLNEAAQALEDFGPESKVFRDWGEIHPDFKGGDTYYNRRVLANRNGVTVVTQWFGPSALEALQES